MMRIRQQDQWGCTSVTNEITSHKKNKKKMGLIFECPRKKPGVSVHQRGRRIYQKNENPSIRLSIA